MTRGWLHAVRLVSAAGAVAGALLAESARPAGQTARPFPGTLDEHPVIDYALTPPTDVVAVVNRALAAGTRTFAHDALHGVSAGRARGPRHLPGLPAARLLEDRRATRAHRTAHATRALLQRIGCGRLHRRRFGPRGGRPRPDGRESSSTRSSSGGPTSRGSRGRPAASRATSRPPPSTCRATSSAVISSTPPAPSSRGSRCWP